MSQQQGFAAEVLAKEYLISQGLCWRASNYCMRMGEIDLIMQDKDCIVFVEVRSRQSGYFGGAVESITAPKRQKIIKTATAYLQRYHLLDSYASRFDVVLFQPPTMRWIKDAFGVDF